MGVSLKEITESIAAVREYLEDADEEDGAGTMHRVEHLDILLVQISEAITSAERRAHGAASVRALAELLEREASS